MADSFEQLMQSARQQLVRMPDGSYRAAPVYGSSTTVPEMYGNTVPAAQNPLPRMDSAGDGSGLSGGYSFLQDMIDASAPPASTRSIPGPSNTTVANKTTDRLKPLPSSLDPMEAYAGVPKTSAQQAIDITVRGGVPLPRARPTTAANLPTVPLPKWGPAWGIGINPDLMWSDSAPGAVPEGDAWQTDRFGEPVRPLPGYATGNRTAATPRLSTGGLLDMVIGALGGGGSGPAPAPSFNANSAASDSPIGQNTGSHGVAGGSVFAAGQQLPSGMNNRRWAGDGY